ncbi:MAG TPA: hypothetical protein PK357_00870 [Candidatus Pacearchaeota archaeon]|nr:hypothetical protein [Candidatus Pacearchaeota archaeon]
MNKKNKKGALEFSFSWIFAMVVGAFILFMTIFAIIKLMDTFNQERGAETAKNIGALLNPLESGFESATKSIIKTQIETRIYPDCVVGGGSNDYFGKQTIRISEKTSSNKWGDIGITTSIQNKYIFSENYVEGKNFYIYSKSFDFPFKVGDLLYLTSNSSSYCFIDAPERIEDEIENSLNAPNILFEDCPQESIRVCFSTSANCDVIVKENQKSVRKNGETVYYEGDVLMYAAIFSSKEIYECQLLRLMKRAEQLSITYQKKSDFLYEEVGCLPEISTDLISLRQKERTLESSADLVSLVSSVDTIEIKNTNMECRLW